MPKGYDGRPKPQPPRGARPPGYTREQAAHYEVRVYLGDQCEWWVGVHLQARSEAEAITLARKRLAVLSPCFEAVARDGAASAQLRR